MNSSRKVRGYDVGLLNRVRDTIVRTYAEERAKRSAGRRYTPHPRWEKTWKRITLLVLDNKYDPERYVRVQFESPHTFPYPNELLSEKARKRYRDFLQQVELRAVTSVRSQQLRCSGWMRLGEPLADILADRSKDLDPLFRYCYAGKCGYAELAEKFKQEAAELARLMPELAAVYERMFPKWMRNLLSS